jgi:glycosyltransferase involved in cell wall biosynthesis
MSKKILYISYDGMTDPLGQSQVLPYLASLATAGYEFTIISFEKRNRFEKDKANIERIVKASGIKWKPLLFSKNPPFLSKVYDRWKLKQTIKKLFRDQQFDMIHCRSYVAAEIGLWAKKKYGTKFLFDMRGFWADEKIDSGQWNLSNPLYKWAYNHYKKREKDFLLNADAVVSLTHAAKNEMHNKPDYKNVEIDVIPCCADLDHFDFHHINPDFTNGLREQLGIKATGKVITYLGSVGGWYMTKEMFSFFKELLLQYPGYTMLVLTKDDADNVKNEAAQYGIPAEKIIVRYAGRNELPDYLSLSDCSIFFIRPTYSKMASSPTKHAELMGMGIPVICNNIGDTGHVIEDTQTGIVINNFNEKEYRQVVAKMPELLAIDKNKIREGAFKYFDLEKGAGEYLQIYKRLLKD